MRTPGEDRFDRTVKFSYRIYTKMRIGLISDTHIRVPGYRAGLSRLCAEALPSQVKDVFRGVDLILHAGDIYTLPILDELEQIAPVLASEGDDDPFEIANDKRVKWRHIINIDGTTIWLAHQPETWYWDENVVPPNVIVFGHSHQATLEKNDGILKVNPGSANFPGYQPVLGSVGLLTIESGKAEAEIIQLK